MLEWNVDPEIFRIGFFAVRYYSLMFMISFMAGIYIFKWIYIIELKPVEEIDTLLVYMLFGTVVGARLGHCLFYDPVYYLSNPLLILKVWEGGLASHGAAIGILFSIYLFSKNRPYQPYLWLVAISCLCIRWATRFNGMVYG